MAHQSESPKGAVIFLPHLLLALLCFGIYAGSLSAPWHFDDLSFIVNDPAVQRLWPIGGQADRPVLTFSLALNNAVCGLDPACFRFVNILIHAATALLLYGLLRRLLGSGRLGSKAAESAQGLAFSMAALWMAHPIHTMAVTYIWQRSESLMSMFFIATLYATLRCAEGARCKTWGVLAVLSCLLGLGTKGVMVAVIPVALIFDAVLLAPSWREALRRRWALHGSLALIALALGVFVAPHIQTSQGELGRWTYAASQPGVVLDYMRLSLWPWPLCFDYDRQPALGWLAVVLPAIPIAVAMGLTIRGLVKRSWMGVAGAIFFLVLAPSSSFIEINDLMVEYRLYLPVLAPVFLVVAFVRFIWDRWSLSLPLSVAFLAGLSALSLATIQRNQDYSSNVRLWKSVVEAAPRNARAANSLAASYLTMNLPGEAIEPARRAVELAPDFYPAHMNLGTALKLTGDIEGALTEFKLARKLKPTADGRVRLGKILLTLDHPEDAEWQFKQALKKKPHMPAALLGLGQARFAFGRYKAAERALLRLVAQDPGQGEAWFMIGLIRIELKSAKGAIEAFERVIDIDDRQLVAWVQIGKLSVQMRQSERAAQAYGRAVKLDPKDSGLQMNYGRALLAEGDSAEAVSVFEGLLRSWPSRAREVSRLGLKLVRGDSMNKQTARSLCELAVRATGGADHLALFSMARVLALSGDARSGLKTLDQIVALPAVRNDPKLLATYERERKAMEQRIR